MNRRMTANFTWTEDRVDLLKKLWDDGATCTAIACHLGCGSRNAVIGKVRRLGLSYRVNPVKPIGHRIRPRNGKSFSGVIQKINRVRSARERPRQAVVAAKAREAPQGFRKSLFDLGGTDCHFIVIDAPAGQFDPREPIYCGAPGASDLTRPYCPYHHALMYVRPGPRGNHHSTTEAA